MLERMANLTRDYSPGAWRGRCAQALAYDEIFANQLALLRLRQSQRRRRTEPLAGTGELTAKLNLPYQLTGGSGA
jgi:RecG-like helicase